MATEHKYAHVLRWIADGKAVQIRWGKDPRWMPLEQRNEIVNDEILRGVGDYEFRIKPRTVKIGSREVEAPVLEPAEGQELWYWNYKYEEPRQSRVPSMNKAHAGVYFASPEACRAAHQALTELLTGSAT